MISAKDLFFGSGLGPLPTGDGRLVDGRTGTERLPFAGEEADICFDGAFRVCFIVDETAGLSEWRFADTDLPVEEDVKKRLSTGRDAGFDRSLPWRDGPLEGKPGRGDFAGVPRSSSSALRFGADRTVLVTVEEDGVGFSPVMDARRSPI